MKKIIVTGERRSGTTFMANFLNSQEKVVCYADFIRTPLFAAEKLKIKDYSRELTERERNIVTAEFKGECGRFSIPIHKDAKIGKGESLKDFMDAAYRALASYSKKEPEVCGVKVTSNLHLLEKLLDQGYTLIYVIRDPRDVLLSDRNRFFDSNAVKVIQSWKKAYDRVQKLKGHPNFILVPYEEFIKKNENLIEKLQNKLGVPLNVDLKRLQMRDNVEYQDNSSFGDVKKLFDQSTIYRWKEYTGDIEVLVANSILKRELKQLDLETLDSPVSFIEILKYYGKSSLLKPKKALYNVIVSFR